MKDSLRRAFDMALCFFGVTKGRPRSRLGRESKSHQSSAQARPSQTTTTTSGVYYQGGESRSAQEIDRYEQVAELLDTHVHSDRGWLKCLAGVEGWQSLSRLQSADFQQAERICQQLSARLFDLVSHFAAAYNTLGRHVVSMTPPSDVSEKRKVGPRTMGSVETTELIIYNRWRASTAAWSLSCRARSGVIEIFLVPASDLMALSQAEVPMRLRMRLELLRVSDRLVWTCSGLPASAEDLRILTRMFFRDLICATQDQEQPVQSSLYGERSSASGGPHEIAPSAVADARLARSIEQLLFERESLAQKVVIQQEEIQKRIARDLHDAVISDVMALKRNISSLKPPDPADVLSSLEVIVRKLREICYDLSPRDLSDWGLATVVDDMLDQIAQRTGIDCVLNCDIEVPVMPAAVLLHIYRIIQESLNNAEKYAEPSRMVVSMEMNGTIFVISIADDGKGFEMSETPETSGRSGGYGMGSLKERADLIRCFYPTRFQLRSAPGRGTVVRLEIDLSHFR